LGILIGNPYRESFSAVCKSDTQRTPFALNAPLKNRATMRLQCAPSRGGVTQIRPTGTHQGQVDRLRNNLDSRAPITPKQRSTPVYSLGKGAKTYADVSGLSLSHRVSNKSAGHKAVAAPHVVILVTAEEISGTTNRDEVCACAEDPQKPLPI
jgi:hypothetical protein